jgi:hypothetical protein
MAEYLGSVGYLSFGGTVLTTACRSFDVQREAALFDASVNAGGYREYIVSQTDGKAVVELLAQASDTATPAALVPGTTGTLIWGRDGSAGGKQKMSVVAIVTGYDESFPYDDLAVINADFQFTSSVTSTTF